MRVRRDRSSIFIALVVALTTLAPLGNAKNKKQKADSAGPQDEIEVVGHIPLADGPVRRFLATQHYSRSYLYAEHDAGTNVTLIDITKSSQPSVLASLAYAPTGAPARLTVVAGTAALVSCDSAPSVPVMPAETIRIMDFSNPQNPKVSREFTGVTAMSRDDRRGLIFVANADGLWILQQHLASDPEVEEAYARYVVYSH